MARSRWKAKHGAYTLRSGLEKKVAQFLDENKVKYEYETLVIKYIVPQENHSYKPDFILANGIIVEVKGNFDAKSRKKMGLVIEQNRDKDIRLLFMRMNKISKNSKTTYGDWCDARGIIYAVSSEGIIPDEWLKARPKRALEEVSSRVGKPARKQNKAKSKATEPGV